MLKSIRNTIITSVTIATAIVTASFSSIQVASAADAANGEKLSQTCLGCHGAPGLRNPGPVYAIPMVGGQHAEYIVSALKAYKDKTRSHKTMQAQASNLTDENMADIAAFFAGLDGNSRPSLVTKLAGQYESYLVHALKDYRSGERENIVMSGQSTNLSIGEIEALSAWFASQQGGLSAPKSKIFK